MKLYQIIQFIDKDLYDLPNLTDIQYSKIQPLLEKISDLLAENIEYVNENNLIIISSLAQKWVTYYDQSIDQNFDTLLKEIDKKFKIDPEINIPNSSLLCALYYLNDMIASSTAIGRGCEESIIHEGYHNQVIVLFLKHIESKENIQLLIKNARLPHKCRKYETLLPLIFDIVETSYASFGKYKISNREIKLSNVDKFYQKNSESCMAKGTLFILRELKSLPLIFLKVLMEIKLDDGIMEQLKICSIDSIETIISEIPNRRYRGGNSATTWVKIRNTVKIECGSASMF